MKLVVVTCGDVGGIGPEVIVRSLPVFEELGVAPVIVGPLYPFARLRLGMDVPRFTPFNESVGVSGGQRGHVYHLECGDCDEDRFVFGRADALNGRTASVAIETAVDLVMRGVAQGMVTAPISKKSLQLAGVAHPGHTTYLQELSGSGPVTMGFYTPRLKTVLATVHVALSRVSGLLDRERLWVTLEHALMFLAQLGVQNPRIAVAGFNPHAGEEGMFGDEERDVICPFVAEAQSRGISIWGPYPADTLYFRAYEGEFDMVISLYHDQGLIPIKLIGFHEAVNVTIGLPFVRTSPDHGTAYDIAYRNQANPASFISAVRLAVQLIRGVSRG